ncbi:MAG: hypothetical protein KIT77_12170 [Caldilinea sp.]|mgnify:CR=1 FL=1|nr:hypothetical protein [Caldilinea sp.]MCB0059702.1 hypothetical protein [Caldilineaceae bacterium]MCB0039343.1 hypothetical protein [Caldilinea sp.]MCB0134432.1 hypothetical protein [Caldilineaceae bacterium]MCB9124190.1 hypothetical protein [Caldilineaceae bacterium]
MFDYTSRYYTLPTATVETSTGREIVYVARRFLPHGDEMPLLVEVVVAQHERLDLVTHRTLGDPLQFWRIADANDAMNPFDLVEPDGQRLRVPVPQP